MHPHQVLTGDIKGETKKREAEIILPFLYNGNYEILLEEAARQISNNTTAAKIC